MDVREITLNIQALAKGEDIALDFVVEGLYQQLKVIAQRQLNRLNPNKQTPNDLVHELYIKLSQAGEIKAESRAHFLSIAASAMRQLVIDQLKAQQSQKRGGNYLAVTLSDSVVPMNENITEILAVDKAMKTLAQINEKLAKTVECKFFAGFSEQETAMALGVNERTVRRYWQRSKRWLQAELYNK
jgi:RNA polymerase sigma factor (TIGR02999 family)